MKAWAIGAALLVTLTSETPVGSTFPVLSGETIDGKKVSIPADTKGKSTIICMAYSDEAEKDLRTWYEPTYDKFIAKTELMSDVYDIHLYFVPMFTGVKAAGAEKAKKEMKESVQPDLHPHVLVYKGELEAYKSSLKMDDKKKPYIYVLDKEGKIVYFTSGAYTEDKMDEVEDHLE